MNFFGNQGFPRAGGQRGIPFQQNLPGMNNGVGPCQPNMRNVQGGSPILQGRSPNCMPQMQGMNPMVRLPMTPPQRPNVRLFNTGQNIPTTASPPVPMWGSGSVQGIRQHNQNPRMPNFQISLPGSAFQGNLGNIITGSSGGLNIQLPPPGSGLGLLDTPPNIRPALPPALIQNLNQSPVGMQQNVPPVMNQSTFLAQTPSEQGTFMNQSNFMTQTAEQGNVRMQQILERLNQNNGRGNERDRDYKGRDRQRKRDQERRSRWDGSDSSRDKRDRSSDSRNSRNDSRKRDRSRDRRPPSDRDTSSRSQDDRRRPRDDRGRTRYADRGSDPGRNTKRRNEKPFSSPDKKRRPEVRRSRSPIRPSDRKPIIEDKNSCSVFDGRDEIELPEEVIPAWVRCSPADLYFNRNSKTNNLDATKRMQDLEDKFEFDLVSRAKRIIESRPKVEKPDRPVNVHHHHHRSHHICGAELSSSSSSDSSLDSDDETNGDEWLQELNRKKQHPWRLHEELWYNDEGEMNDGPLCKCSLKAQRTGIRHAKYPGEEAIPKCNPGSNNSDCLYHYRITVSPPTNFLTKNPTIIEYDNHEYIFEGFSIFSHSKLEKIPVCKVIRFNIDYTIHFIEESVPENFSIRSLDLFQQFLFTEILELVDLDWKGPGSDENCNRFHLMPRFARSLPENGKEILSMNEVLNYLLKSSKPLMEETELSQLLKYDQQDWQNFVDEIRGMVVTYPGMKPSALRIDQLDRQQSKQDVITYPLIIHFGIRPAQLSYAGDPTYQRMWKHYVKFKHLLNSKPKVSFADKQKLEMKEKHLQDLRLKSTMKREVTVELSSEGFLRSGVKSDITQHAMLIPVLLGHLRFHQCLNVLEKHLGYSFEDRSLLQLALTHTSYKVNYGTNPDHARNSLSNCGMRQLEYGDRKIHYVHTRKRGINILINIMSRLGKKEEFSSEIPHNERLEFLGDAVVEFITSVHLFYMFPFLEEGGLTTYRAAIVQNQHLAVLAKKLRLQDFMLYAHGPDLCHESDLKHAMANCFEALMGALFLDGGITLTDKIFSKTLFEEEDLLSTWDDMALHPLQEDEPNGDRHWIGSSPALQKLVNFEDALGLKFNHIRLMARAFTLRSVGFNNLTLGHNQRLEFLGDTVLQLVASEYLFRHFPDHHEGHLSLLRSSLVNNRTQSIVCDDLGMSEYVIYAETRGEKLDMKTKEKADLLEAFIGSLYVDQDLDYCNVFCNVCFFPRLKDFIMNQDWNDPKSQLQQCCLTLRELDGGEPDIPIYKMIESIGPTNTRRYTVAVYFRGERLATGLGHSIQQAEMAAALNALNERSELFPILSHQKRFLERKHKKKRHGRRSGGSSGGGNTDKEYSGGNGSGKNDRIRDISDIAS